MMGNSSLMSVQVMTVSMQAKKNDLLRSQLLCLCFFAQIGHIFGHPLDGLTDEQTHRNLHKRDIPPVSGVFNTSWTADTTSYEIVIDTSDCDYIPKKTLIGDLQLLNNDVKLDANYNDLLVDGYDRLRQNPSPADLQEAKVKHLLANMRAAEKELSGLIEIPTTAVDSGHDELRRLLFSQKEVVDSLLQKAKFTVFMFPQLVIGYVLGGAVGFKVQAEYLAGTTGANETAAQSRSQKMNELSGLYLQYGLLVGSIYIIIALIARFGAGMTYPVPLFTNEEYIAILVFVAWLRRMARQMVARRPAGFADQPGAVAAAGLQALPMLVQLPQDAPQGVDGVVTQPQMDALQQQRAQGIVGANSIECV